MPKKKVTTKKIVKATKKSPAKKPAPVVAPVAYAEPVKTDAEKIWEEIQHLPIEMFALPNQVVAQHCEPLPFAIDPSRLFLITRSTATLPSLEFSLQSFTKNSKTRAEELAKKGHVVEVKEYTVELADKYVIVGRAINSHLLAQYLKK
jgi:hypothetical protein